MNQVVSAYYVKQDWNDLYASADKAVAKDPDDVDVLTVVGWMIPHLYNKDDPDADKKLDKAENYEKHAIDVIRDPSEAGKSQRRPVRAGQGG